MTCDERDRKMLEDDIAQFVQFWVAAKMGRFDFGSEVVHHVAEFGNFCQLGSRPFAVGFGVRFAGQEMIEGADAVQDEQLQRVS